MATDVLVWTGSGWESIRGPQGPEGPTAVSTDAVNLAKLGTDGRIFVPQSDLDARYVNVPGDTMTGPLAITSTSVGAGVSLLSVATESGQAQVIAAPATAAGTQPRFVLRNSRGTLSAPAPLQNGDEIGRAHV